MKMDNGWIVMVYARTPENSIAIDRALMDGHTPGVDYIWSWARRKAELAALVAAKIRGHRHPLRLKKPSLMARLLRTNKWVRS